MMLFINNNTRKTKIYLKWYINEDLSILLSLSFFPFTSLLFHSIALSLSLYSPPNLNKNNNLFSENWLISDMNRRKKKNFKYKVSKSFTRLFPKRFISLLFQRMMFFFFFLWSFNLFDFTPLHYLELFIRQDLRRVWKFETISILWNS